MRIPLAIGARRDTVAADEPTACWLFELMHSQAQRHGCGVGVGVAVGGRGVGVDVGVEVDVEVGVEVAVAVAVGRGGSSPSWVITSRAAYSLPGYHTGRSWPITRRWPEFAGPTFSTMIASALYASQSWILLWLIASTRLRGIES